MNEKIGQYSSIDLSAAIDFCKRHHSRQTEVNQTSALTHAYAALWELRDKNGILRSFNLEIDTNSLDNWINYCKQQASPQPECEMYRKRLEELQEEVSRKVHKYFQIYSLEHVHKKSNPPIFG